MNISALKSASSFNVRTPAVSLSLPIFRRICEFLAVKKCITHVYVTTEYGKELLPGQNNVHIHVGKMDEGQMSDEISVILPDIVIDATHPYATQVTHNIKEACDSRNIFYVRVLREENTEKAGNNADNIIYTETMKDAVRLLNDDRFIHKNVLMTTGSKNIPEYVYIKDFKDRLYLRLLPNPQMMESAIQAGIMPAHLIGMQGPFSQELNEAVIRQFNIGVLVTKESGNNGGYEEKISATLNTGTDCIVIRRPLENGGKNLSEIIAYLEENIDSQC